MKVLIIAVTALLISGCSSTKNWSATGGSRADATVRLSYEYGLFENPQVNEQEAINLATARCATWGYTGAEAFGGITRQCNSQDGMGSCNIWIVHKEFQCTGTGTGTGTTNMAPATN